MFISIYCDRLGTDNHHEIKESYNISSLKSVFPSEDANPEFRSAVIDLALKLSELTRRLLTCMALALGNKNCVAKVNEATNIMFAHYVCIIPGLDKNYFVDRHRFMFEDQDKNPTTFRTLYYPSLSDSDIQPGVVRCGAHSDYGTITLLLQDGVGGLEVELM